MISLVAPLLVLLLFLWVIRRLARGQTGRGLLVKATVLIAAFRLCVLWALLFLHWRGALGLWAVPVMFVLLPEGFLLPRNLAWTSSTALIASALVMVGSLVWAIAIYAALGLGGRARHVARGSGESTGGSGPTGAMNSRSS